MRIKPVFDYGKYSTNMGPMFGLLLLPWEKMKDESYYLNLTLGFGFFGFSFGLKFFSKDKQK